jgi:hypothetical protein
VIIFGARLCDPTTKLWAKAIEGTCGNEYNYFLGVEVSNLVLDLLLLLLPVFASQQKWFYVAAIGLLVSEACHTCGISSAKSTYRFSYQLEYTFTR